MDIVKNVKQLISQSIKQIHQNSDPAPILYRFEQNLQELKSKLPENQREALEDYARKVWLLYDEFLTSVENEDERMLEVLM
ncbi:MAG: hypothetical protein HFI90_06965 [Clostridia bacterium]|nr:hypothetical protein [Clostridia bacterium]